jgi:hypothetical protein
MTLPPTLLIRVLSALALTAVVVGDVQAQSSRSVKVELMLPDNRGNFTVTSEQTRIRDYFNLARCQCAELAPSHQASIFKTRLSLDDTAAESQPAELHVGTACADNDPLQRRCERVTTIEDIQNLRGGMEYDIPVDQFMFPNDVCQELVITRNVWVLYDDGANNMYDEDYTLASAVEMDAQPPPLPSEPVASGAEGAVQISWALPAARAGDIKYVHVLCVRAGDTAPLFGDRAGDAQYDTTRELCDVESPQEPVLPGVFAELDPSLICETVSGTATSARVEGLENGVSYQFALLTVDDARNASAVYLGEAEPAPAVDFWEDYQGRGGTAEGGVCLVNSTFGGGSGPTQAMRDFRDNTLAHHALGRAVIDSYYGFVAPLGAYVDRSPALRVVAAVVLMPLAGLAAFWEYTSPVIKMLVLLFFVAMSRRVRSVLSRATSNLSGRRRAPVMAMAAPAVLAVLIWSTPVRAQSPNDPWSDEFQPINEETAPVGRSYWNFGIKLGPYVPAIDSALGVAEGEMGPYGQMFGGSAVMGAIELDRYFLWPLGQLGVTASLGWMGKSANAYLTVECPEPASPDCMNGFMVARDENGNPIRSAGDTTAFRLMPASLGVVYRFTELDDRFRIPVVPYGKAGLSYYLWWITQPDGSIAEAPTDACPDPEDPAMDCQGNRALGASLGWQASLGLAIRAERIDRGAAQSLANDYGIEHAGLYAEMTYAQVDGFGSDSRLSVGGFTWFAGMNFEF